MPTAANTSAGGCPWDRECPLGRPPQFNPQATGHVSLEVARAEIRKQEAAAHV
ncbi:MAG: hypothetical protein AAB654_18405 [Acidobacteriota bacterium]